MIDKINEIYKKHKNAKFIVDWKPRKGIFSTSSGHLTFNPETFDGYSYNWYKICSKINGIFILNSYQYSVTTGGHASDLASLFNTLKVSFTCLEAPRGLQDLESSRNHLIRQIARVQVLNKYARSATYSDWDYREQADLLLQLGLKPITKDEIELQSLSFEGDRKRKLERARKARHERRHEKFKDKFEALINSGESHAQA